MKTVFLFVSILWVSSLVELNAQTNIVSIDENGKDISHKCTFSVQNTDSIYPLPFFDSIVVPKHFIITFFQKGYQDQKYPFEEAKKIDTLRFYRKTQSFDEVTILSSARRKESADSTHVVYFHFVNGQLFTLEKTIFNQKNKFLICKELNLKLPVHPKATFEYSSLGLYINYSDSVFELIDKRLEFLMPYKEYFDRLSNCIGKIDNTFYFKNHIFYGLIDEYESYNTFTSENRYMNYAYDRKSFEFISHQYNNPSSILNRGKEIALFYGNGHPYSGQRFTNREKIKMSDIGPSEGHLFNYLLGTIGFQEMTGACAPAVSDGKVFNNNLYLINLNNSEVLIKKVNEPFQDTIKIEDVHTYYEYKSAMDYGLGKIYFLCKKSGAPFFMEFDCNTNLSKIVHAPRGIFTQYHWEINDGRIYFILSDGNLEWQRHLYSVAIGDLRY